MGEQTNLGYLKLLTEKEARLSVVMYVSDGTIVQLRMERPAGSGSSWAETNVLHLKDTQIPLVIK